MVTFIVSSTISLVIQIVVLALLIGAFMLKYQKKFRQHGITMLTAVVLHIISILVVMVPSVLSFFGGPISNFADLFVVITLVHVPAGILAAFLGVWLVSSWHLQKNLQTCFKKKRVMDVTMTVWLLAIFLGIILYLKINQVI